MKNFNPNVLSFVIILFLILVVVWMIKRKIKLLTIPNVFLISGAVKTGKTLLSVHLAIKEYKRALRRWHIKRLLYSLIGRKDDIPLKPMLYSNIVLAKVKFNVLTMDIILQKKRIPHQSKQPID